MKKILVLTLALLILGGANMAYAQNRTAAPERTLNLACVQSDVAIREGAIQKAFMTFSGSISSALSARATALNTAWGMTVGTERRAARKTAWEAYRTASNEARTAFKTSKKSAWDTFKTASKNCKVEVVESELNDNII